MLTSKKVFSSFKYLFFDVKIIESLLIKTLYICYVILDEDIAKKLQNYLQINAIKFNHKILLHGPLVGNHQFIVTIE